MHEVDGAGQVDVCPCAMILPVFASGFMAENCFVPIRTMEVRVQQLLTDEADKTKPAAETAGLKISPEYVFSGSGLPVGPIPWRIALGVGGGLGIGLAGLCGLGDLRLQDLLVTFRGYVGGFF